MKVYLIGSLRNPEIPAHAQAIRELGFDVFDDWFAAGPEADDYWKKYEQERGRSYEEALKGYAGRHVFAFDKHHIDEADIGILILPAGRSGHLELGYMAGQGAATYILHDDPERWDCMYQFADGVFFKKEDLYGELSSLVSVPEGLDGVYDNTTHECAREENRCNLCLPSHCMVHMGHD